MKKRQIMIGILLTTFSTISFANDDQGMQNKQTSDKYCESLLHQLESLSFTAGMAVGKQVAGEGPNVVYANGSEINSIIEEIKTSCFR